MDNQERHILTYGKGKVIFSQNSTPSDTLYDIHYGSVALYDSYGTEQEVKLATLRANEFFGEIDMIEGKPRSFTAVTAEKDTRISAIDEKTFRTYFSVRPAKLFQIMQSLDSRIEGQAKRYMNLCRTIYQAYMKNPEDVNNITLEAQQTPMINEAAHQNITVGDNSISTLELEPGQVLFQQGELGTVMYEVTSGEIVLTAGIGADQTAVLSTLKEGQCLGVSGIVNIRPRAATATAGPGGAVVKVINAESFERYFRENEEKVMEIMRYMAMLLRDINASYTRLRSSVEAKKLTELAPPTGLRAVLLKVASLWQDSCQ